MKCNHIIHHGKACNGNLELIPASYPWSEKHYQCDVCYSTFLFYVVRERIKQERDIKINTIIE